MGIEQLIQPLMEKTLVGGAFLYLLYNQTNMVKSISASLVTFGEHLKDVSDTLLKMDMRMESLEKRMEHIEDKEA